MLYCVERTSSQKILRKLTPTLANPKNRIRIISGSKPFIFGHSYKKLNMSKLTTEQWINAVTVSRPSRAQKIKNINMKKPEASHWRNM